MSRIAEKVTKTAKAAVKATKPTKPRLPKLPKEAKPQDTAKEPKAPKPPKPPKLPKLPKHPTSPKDPEKAISPAGAEAARTSEAQQAPDHDAAPVDESAQQKPRPSALRDFHYPLSKQLSAVLGLNGRKGLNNLTSPDNLDVVSPELCDDILNYIGPSLEKYKGCDIIDIHPGACLWSQKLHDFLKPRRHLLMEPDQRYFDPFIKPLLDQKDSTYRHTFLSGGHPKRYWETYDQIFNGDLLPERDALPPGHASLREPNNSLLVVGCLTRRYHDYRAHNNHVNHASLLLGQMAKASQTNSLFHAYGLVRMLLWAPEDTRSTVLPDSIVQRHGYATGLESAVKAIEVAGTDRTSACDTSLRPRMKWRHSELETFGARRVLERMQRKGISIPEHRSPIMHQTAQKYPSSALAAYNPIHVPEGSTLQTIVEEHEKRVLKLQRKLKQFKSSKRGNPDLPYRLKWTSTAKIHLEDAERLRVGPYLETWGAQVALEIAVCMNRDKLPEEAQADIKQRLLSCNNVIKETCDKHLLAQPQKRTRSVMGEVFALCRETPLLAWDRRPFEPLTVKAEEFWPHSPMYLLDMVPRRENLANDLVNASEASQIQRELIKTLFTHYAAPLEQALERAGPNGGQDLVAAVPELMDASKGGRLDVSNLTPRDLTVELLTKVAKAYIEWPFRPSVLEPNFEELDEAL